MNEQPEDLFTWGESKTQEPSVDSVEIHVDPIKDDKLGYDCIQCEIGGGSCPRHPRDIDDLIHIPNNSASSEKPFMDDEENDGGMRLAIQAELEHELEEDEPMSPEDLEKYFGDLKKSLDPEKPMDPEV